MELRGNRGLMGGQDLRGQGLGFGAPASGPPASSIITAVQQQDYSASVWLRRRDKLEHVSCGFCSWGLRNRWKEVEVMWRVENWSVGPPYHSYLRDANLSVTKYKSAIGSNGMTKPPNILRRFSYICHNILLWYLSVYVVFRGSENITLCCKCLDELSE